MLAYMTAYAMLCGTLLYSTGTKLKAPFTYLNLKLRSQTKYIYKHIGGY